jgi:hypothetical protein
MKLSWVKMYPYFRLLFSLNYWTKRHELRTSLKQFTEHFTNTLTQNGNHPVSDCAFHSWYNLFTITIVVGLHMNVIRPQGCLEVATDLNAERQNPPSPTAVFQDIFTSRMCAAYQRRRETPFPLQMMGAFPPHKPTAVESGDCVVRQTPWSTVVLTNSQSLS